MLPVRKSIGIIATVLLIIFTSFSFSAGKSLKTSPAIESADETASAVLWRPAADICNRDLYFGPGGADGAPRAPFVFLKEDLDGTNAKFDIRDSNGVKWKVKLGLEARPETAASRLIWAVGYFATEDYYLPSLRVENLPAHLQRGQEFLASDGSITDARLKRLPGHMKKTGNWSWKKNPFTCTREFNGLRVMMALINDWDLKDVNNAIYKQKDSNGGSDPVQVYMVSDLGASFGSGRWSHPLSDAKGNLQSYSRSKFIDSIEPDYLDFELAPRPTLIHAAVLPAFTQYLGMRWIGKGVPRSDVKWIGHLLAQLSPDQIRDAFRAASYSTEEIEGFTEIILSRIAQLNNL